MKKLLIFLLLALSVSANAQISKKAMFFSLANSSSTPVDTSDPTYQALLTYATANAITKPSDAQNELVEQGFKYITTNVGWSKIKAMWLPCAPNTTFGYLNVVNPGTNTLTVTGTMTHTANIGVLSSNTSSWLSTNGLTGEYYGIGGITNGTGNQISTLMGRNNGGTTIEHIVPHSTSNGTFFGSQSTQYNQALEINVGSTGLNFGTFHVHHDGTNVEYFYNGKKEATQTTGKSTRYTAEYFISATNHPTTKYVNTQHNIAVAYVIDAAVLTDDEVWHLHAGINMIRMGMLIGSEAVTPDITSTPAWFAKSATPKVYFIWGQSNAYGNVNNSGEADYQDAVPNAYVMSTTNQAQWELLLDQNINKRLTTATTRFGIEQKLARLINAPTFYTKYASDGMPLSPNEFDIASGSSNNFYPPPSGANSGLFYNNTKNAFLAVKNEVLREFADAEFYFLGIHGEADGLDATEALLYDDYFTTFLSTLETDLGITFDGVYLSKLPTGMNAYSPTIYTANINASLDNLLSAGTIDGVIDTEDCELSGDHLHYTRDGLDQLAQNFYYTITGTSPPPTPPVVLPQMYFTTVAVSGGNANVLVKEPTTVGTPPTNGWPVAIYYGGDGSDNNATTQVTGQSFTGGPTSWTLTATNSGNNRILASSLVIYDDGVEIAHGNIGGTITGTGITGTIGLTGSSSTIAFTSASISGAITANYVHSALLVEGAPLVANLGDTFDDRMIFVAVQNRANDSDMGSAYFDKVIEYLWNTYTIDPNRISLWGLSRGGRAIYRGGLSFALPARYEFWINPSNGVVATSDPGGYTHSGIASMVAGTADIGGTYSPASYRTGLAIVHGTSDAILTNNIPNLVNTWGAATTTREQPYTLNLYGGSHNATTWHTNCYFRKYRTDVSGTANWDFVDFTLRYSLDDEDEATLFVEQAEKRRVGTELDIIDYREALRKVESLTAGAAKTALQGRLVTLKSTLDGLVTWRAVINHTTSGITASGNINNMTTHVDNARVDDLIDDNGTTLTGIDFFIGNNPLGSTFEAEFTSNRGRGNVGGFEQNVNRAGMTIGSTVCPVGFDGLASGTYTLRIYHNETSGGFSNIQFTATIGGVTRTIYSQYNRMLGYAEWTGLSNTNLANFNLGRNNGDTYVTAMEIIKN